MKLALAAIAIFVCKVKAIIDYEIILDPNKECAQENGLDFKDVEEYELASLENPKYQCYVKCAYLRANFSEENWKINDTAIEREILRNLGDPVDYGDCLQEYKDKDFSCEMVTKFHICVINKVMSDLTEKSKRINAACEAENGVVVNDDLYYDDDLYEDRKYRCYLKCTYQRWGVIDEDGKYDMEELKEELDDVKNLDAILDGCIAETDNLTDVCDRVYMMQLCVRKQRDDEKEAQLEEIREKCVEDLSLDGEVLYHLENDTIYEDKKNRCLLRCIYTKTEYMDDSGKMNADVWVENYAHEVKNVTEAFEKCLEKHDDEEDLCDKIYKFEKCVSNEGD